MHQRNTERMPINLSARFPCANAFCPGTVTDLSENGLFINTELCFPVDSKIQIFIKLKDEMLKLPVEIVRIVKSGYKYTGMGVKILSIPKQYLEFVIKLHLNDEH